ncbi:MAG: molybdate ABC transporter substrate-binding protein [Lachnospiraceae bacterium]|nr:molybdate ABC transporter substrate-binding protein [Lachnospiraceae bacterium]
MKKKIAAMIMTVTLAAAALVGCGIQKASTAQETTVTLFAAKSLNTVMEDLIAAYQETHPNVKIVGSYDSSGTLMTQIEEGAACDVFFSAAQKQMNQLEQDGLLVDGTRYNVVNNQVCVVTYKGSNTAVTGLEDLSKAGNLALADGSVPVGKYTRQALVNAGILNGAEDVSKITTQEVSEALGGIEINECANVGAVTSAVAEAANEAGTVYYSDTYGFEDKLEILEKVPYDLTGNVIYPIAQVVNKEADELQQQAAKEFVEYLVSDEAKAVFDKYYFDTNVGD